MNRVLDPVYHSTMLPATAFVLAGGRSSRMGSDKALLTLGEQTLLERALHTVSQVAPKVLIVGSRVRYGRFAEVVEDVYPGCGPLGGIHAALKETDTDRNLILSVDMPLMSASFLSWLVQQAAEGIEMITVPDTAGTPQPLCAVYRREALDAAEQALASGDYKVDRLFSKVATRVITEQEIIGAGFSPAIFRNVNTPAEFEQVVSSTLITVEPGETNPQ